jgi:acyl-CoA synthetase (AMP-forming)/AMP-acid ligase II
VKAVVVLRQGASVTPQDLIDHCRTLIASYKRPRHVEFVDEIVKLPSGKIDKVRLRKLYGTA